GLVEGPHIFKRNGWYYLTTAEGGTGYGHAVTMARSRSIDGPYEMHPDRHIITSKDAPDAILQRAGRGQHVETPDGEAYHTHLCRPPRRPPRHATLGRQTALQKCRWETDWLYAAQGGVGTDIDVRAPGNLVPLEQPKRIETRFQPGPLPAEF